MILEHDNTTQHVKEWALDYGIPADLIALRIAAGWTTADAIETEMPADHAEALADRRRLKAKAAYRETKANPKPTNPKPQTLISLNGETLTVRQWSDRLGISRDTIHVRLKRGLPVERVLEPRDLRADLKGSEPSIFITHKGQTRTVAEWSRATGLNVETIRHRYRRGLSPDLILDPRRHIQHGDRKPRPNAFYITALGHTLTLTEWSKRTGITMHTLRARIVIQGMTGDDAVTKPVRPGGRTPKAKTGGVGRAQDVNAGTGALPTAQISRQLENSGLSA